MAREYRKRRPASTPELREQQLISDAMDFAEEQIRKGTASSQIVTHFLKEGSPRAELEREKLRQENEKLRAQVMQLASAKRVEELYDEAIKAMRMYSGNYEEEEIDDYDY
ncbi:hypothetical protein KC887_07265 [Candidatus Kaiserbacteria bacterium]|nr:hypothetical protein [Candidatus Kaiserbacteria bacterium]